MFIKLVSLNARFSHSCLALFYIRNELARYIPGARVEILHFTINDNYYENLLNITEGTPHAIFFSAAIWNSERVMAFVRDMQLSQTESQIVIGGPQAEVIGEQLVKGDCCRVIGEIENVDESFYEDLLNNNLQAVYRAGRGGGKTSFSYPYHDGDFTKHLKNRYVYYESSRGCPFSCTYCLSANDKGVYHKPLQQVKEELGHILSYRPKVVRFVDRTFNDRPQRALAIWKFIREQKGSTLFHFEISPDRFSDEMYNLLEKVPLGKFQFEIGIQSTHHKTLKAINRSIDPLQAHKTVAKLAVFGNIHLHVDLILGLPYETAAHFSDSFRDVFAMGGHYIQMGLLKILPDTPICHSAGEFGYIYSQRPPYSVLANKWMDQNTLAHHYWFSECVEKFYNNRYFCSLWSYLRRKKEDIASFFSELLQICRKKSLFDRAATQEFLCELLVHLAQGREDRALFLELVRFDWLRCGHRYLPGCLLTKDGEEPVHVRKQLYSTMPEKVEGLYDRLDRDRFFKKGLFFRFSGETLMELKFVNTYESRYLRFAQEREESLYKYNRVSLV